MMFLSGDVPARGLGFYFFRGDLHKYVASRQGSSETIPARSKTDRIYKQPRLLTIASTSVAIP
jgi:hypothetical protein